MTQPRLSGDSVRAYLRDIGRIPLLAHDEEILLGRKVQKLMELEDQMKELGLDAQGLAEAWDLPVKQIKREFLTKAKNYSFLRLKKNYSNV